MARSDLGASRPVPDRPRRRNRQHQTAACRDAARDFLGRHGEIAAELVALDDRRHSRIAVAKLGANDVEGVAKTLVVPIPDHSHVVDDLSLGRRKRGLVKFGEGFGLVKRKRHRRGPLARQILG